VGSGAAAGAGGTAAFGWVRRDADAEGFAKAGATARAASTRPAEAVLAATARSRDFDGVMPNCGFLDFMPCPSDFYGLRPSVPGGKADSDGGSVTPSEIK
jgi:hypothetical protein